MKSTIRKFVNSMGFDLIRMPAGVDRLIEQYKAQGMQPWSNGYKEYKGRYISNVLDDKEQMNLFKNHGLLKSNYGIGIDERCIEYPWYFSHSDANARNILDAGSALNHEFIINSNFLYNKKLTILTLAPESSCFWRSGVSYEFSEIQKMPFRDVLFDEVVCISTLEHVGMDNEIYTKAVASFRDHAAFEQAVLDMKRVLKPEGSLFLTVPFGKYQDWGMFQQFDERLLERVIELFKPVNCTITIYAYTDTGWQKSDIDACRNCEFSEYAVSCWKGGVGSIDLEKDRAAAARAVACMQLVKGE